MSPSEEKKLELEPADSSTSKGTGLLRRVVVEGEEGVPPAETPPDKIVKIEVPPPEDEKTTDPVIKKNAKPKKPKKPNAAKIRADRLKAEVDKIIEAGTFNAKHVPDPLVIKPMGKFVEVVSVAFAGLMERSKTPPIDTFQTIVRDEHPDWHPDRVAGVAIQRFVAERGQISVVAAAKISAESNLMYELAGLAVEQDREWAESHLLPGEAMRITRAALEIGEVRDYLGESLSILGTEIMEEDDEKEDGVPTPSPSGDESEVPSSDSTASGQEDSSG